MIYYFTKEQYQLIDKRLDIDLDLHKGRIAVYTEWFNTKYKLKYMEETGMFNVNSMIYWGDVEGTEQHINFFLLQL